MIHTTGWMRAALHLARPSSPSALPLLLTLAKPLKAENLACNGRQIKFPYEARSSINSRFLVSLVWWCLVVGLSFIRKALLEESVEDQTMAFRTRRLRTLKRLNETVRRLSEAGLILR